MKFRTMIAAAGLVIASLGASVAADAQPNRGDRYERHERRSGYDRHDRYDRRNHRGRGYSKHRRCRPVYRNGRRLQVCR